MNKYSLLALMAIIVAGGAGTASAEEHRPTLKDMRAELNVRAKEVRKDIVQLRTAGAQERAEMREVRDTRMDEAKIQRTKVRTEVKAAQTPEERKAIMDTARDARAEVRGENKELRAEFKANAQDRLKAKLAHIKTRLNVALERLTLLTERIQNYIDKKGAAGADVSLAQDILDESVDAQVRASVQVVEVGAIIDRILASDTPKEGMDELRTAVKEATEAIRQANNGMKEAIRAARAIKNTE
jgi:signal transduction histidine kinase